MNEFASVGRVVDAGAAAQLVRARLPRRALFLDRDGIVNVDREYVHTPAETQWVPGIFELAGDAHAHGTLIVVVTNQAGIGRGLYDEATFRTYTAWIHQEFSRRGVPLLATFFCPHHPRAGVGGYRVECCCRKPAPGMILSAAAAFGLDLPRSGLVGDQPSDVEAGLAAGLGRCVRVPEGGRLPRFDEIMPEEAR